MEARSTTHSLTVTLPDYNRELQYEIRREPRGVVIKLQFDYKYEEFRYVVGQLFSEKRLAKQQRKQLVPPLPQTLTERQALADHLSAQLEHHRPSSTIRRGQRASSLHWPDEVADIVLVALRTFGFDVLRLSPTDTQIVRRRSTGALTYSYLVSFDRLGTVVGEVIRDWQGRVKEELDPQKRQPVHSYLQQAFQALLPDSRGKRENRVRASGLEVKRHYYGELFRCEQATALLKKTTRLPGCRRWVVRLRAVCEYFGIPRDPQWWGLSEERQVLRQLLNSKESAILLTARHFSPTKEQTIRNILSR